MISLSVKVAANPNIIAQAQSITPTKPLATEAELLIPGNVRMKVHNYKEEDIGGGKRLTIYCEEE